MTTRLDIVEYICEQINEAGAIRYKKMFGDYMVYLEDKPIFLICEDTLYVKICDTTTLLLGEECDTGYPYNGARLHYIIDILDDRDKMIELAKSLEKITPLPKQRKKKSKNSID